MNERKDGRARAASASPADALADSEIRYRLLVESVRDYAIFMLDPEGHVLTWNEGARLIKGWTRDEIVGSHFSRFYKQEEIDRGWPEYELTRAAADGRFEDESWRVRKDGSQFWANVVITALRDEQGELVGFSKVTRDLTERREHEEALRQSEERFRMLVEHVTEYAIFMLDPQGRVATWNTGARQIYGYESQEIVGSHIARFCPADVVERGWPEHELRVATLQGRFEDEGWRIRKDGSRYWANVVITALRDASGSLVGFSKITRDLSDRREHEQALTKSETRFRLLVESVEDHAIIMLDPNGFVGSWNGGASRILGYSAEEICGKHLSHFYSERDVAEGKPWAQLNRARESRRVADEGWRIRGDFSSFWASEVITALFDDEGRLYGFAQVMQDLTQKRQGDEYAAVAKRVRDFVGLLAHELRNPLAPIRNAVELMGKRGVGDPALEGMRQTIDRQSVHLVKVVDELADVSRIVQGLFTVSKARIDLRDVFRNAVEMSTPLIDARGHEMHVDVPAEDLPYEGDSFRLTQTVAALLDNAAKFTPSGGKIWLTAARRNQQVEIRVRDTGRGFRPDSYEAIFEPFKQIDSGDHRGGLGVGLALARKVVELHGGTIECRSPGLGEGSEFVVRLPLPISERTQAGWLEALSSTPRLRILVVDDNPDSAESLRLLVETMGHEARAAYGGGQGLLAAAEFQPDVAMLNIVMPEMSGYELAEKLAGRDGARRVTLVAVTGLGQEGDERRAKDAGFAYHLVKPVSERTLALVLEEIHRAEG